MYELIYDSSQTARRKSNAASAFLDVPGANFYKNDNNDDTVTLRTFSASNKGWWWFFFVLWR